MILCCQASLCACCRGCDTKAAPGRGVSCMATHLIATSAKPPGTTPCCRYHTRGARWPCSWMKLLNRPPTGVLSVLSPPPPLLLLLAQSSSPADSRGAGAPCCSAATAAAADSASGGACWLLGELWHTATRLPVPLLTTVVAVRHRPYVQ